LETVSLASRFAAQLQYDREEDELKQVVLSSLTIHDTAYNCCLWIVLNILLIFIADI